jgi:hypothetical protein
MATATAADYSTTSIANGLYYPLSSNPAGYLTSAPVTSVAGRTGAVTLSTSDISGLGTAATFADTAFLKTANNLSDVTASTARTNLGLGTAAVEPATKLVPAGGTTGQVLVKNSNTDWDDSWATISSGGTWGSITGTLSSQTDLQSALDAKAPLASPSLTGTPTAPTATAGTNTTQIATTAFVTAAVPAFATFTTPGPTATTTALSPAVMMSHIMHGGFKEWGRAGGTLTAGTGASVGINNYSASCTEIVGPNAGVAGYAMAVWDTSSSGFGMLGMARGVNGDIRNWSKPFWASGRGQLGFFGNTSYNGTASSVVRASVGGKSSGSSGDISVNEPGVGWYFVPGSAMVFQVSRGNGTALTNVTTSFTPVAQQVFDWKIYSDGAGNCTLYVNDTQVATTTAGPTNSSEQYNFYFEMVEQTSAAGTRIAYESYNSKIYWGA